MLLRIVDEKENYKDIIEQIINVANLDRIKPGESSIVLETKKLEKDEMELLNKIVDKIPSLKT